MPAYPPESNVPVFDDLEVRIVQSGPSNPQSTGLFDSYIVSPLKRFGGALFGQDTFSYVALMQLANGSTYRATLKPLPGDLDSMSDPRQYGQALFDWLFPGELHDGFLQARWDAESVDRSVRAAGRIRFRLSLDKGAPELHRIWWEALYDPARQTELALQMPISRFVRDGLPRLWPVSARPLRLLCVLSNPPGVEKFEREPFDLSTETEMIGQSLSEVSSLLEKQQLAPAPSAQDFAKALTEVRPHILFMLAHAVYSKTGEGSLLFTQDGAPCPLSFADFANLIAEAPEAPYLVFLLSPSGKHVASTDSLSPLAHRLVKTGVQAVVTVHAPLDRPALLRFTETFFSDLIRNGIVDSAVMAGRRNIYKAGEWKWCYPVLYLRAADATLFAASSGIESKLTGLSKRLFAR